MEQAPLDASQRHLTNQGFQNFLSNTFWCTTVPNPAAAPGGLLSQPGEWFSVWDGSPTHHSPLDVEYNNATFYLTLWPRLLKVLLHQWAERVIPHKPSGGRVGPPRPGPGDGRHGQRLPPPDAGGRKTPTSCCSWRPTPVGPATPGRGGPTSTSCVAWRGTWRGPTATRRGSRPTAWRTRSSTRCPPCASPASRRISRSNASPRCAPPPASSTAPGAARRPASATNWSSADTRKIEEAAWLGDHYAVAVDKSAVELVNPDTGEPLDYEDLAGWDAYSIYTGNGLLLPEFIGQPPLLDRARLTQDVYRANRECQGPLRRRPLVPRAQQPPHLPEPLARPAGPLPPPRRRIVRPAVLGPAGDEQHPLPVPGLHRHLHPEPPAQTTPAASSRWATTSPRPG